MKNIQVLILLLSIAVFSSSCSTSDEAVVPDLSVDVVNALQATLTDEYKAQITYQKVLDDFRSSTRPFVNIKSAEIKHADAIISLMNKYGIEVPTNSFRVEEMPVFNSVKAACALGVIAEIENIELYDSYLTLDLPADVRAVFENNRSASLNNHLLAFENCSN
jgi:hypothetical protein